LLARAPQTSKKDQDIFEFFSNFFFRFLVVWGGEVSFFFFFLVNNERDKKAEYNIPTYQTFFKAQLSPQCLPFLLFPPSLSVGSSSGADGSLLYGGGGSSSSAQYRRALLPFFM
jgi:hypothetical protein